MEPTESSNNGDRPTSAAASANDAVPVFSPLDRETFTFLRMESEAARNTLREESKANRDALLGTLKIIAYPLAAVIAVAGFLGWRSFSDLKSAIQTEARQETNAEIKQMQTEIHDRLNSQFQTPKLRTMVSDAAREQTGTVLRPLIVKEVGSDVARSVREQQPTIRSAIVTEAHKAVNGLTPTIEGIVQTHVNSTVDKAVDAKISTEISPVLVRLQANEQISNLILNAQGENARAFDQLVHLSSDQTVPENERESLLAIVRAIVQQHNVPVYTTRIFVEKKTDNEMLQLLHDPDPNTRKAVLDGLSKEAVRAHIPEIVTIMTTDPNLMVREAGFIRFNEIRNDPDPKHHIDNLDNGPAIQWWMAHQNEFLRKSK